MNAKQIMRMHDYKTPVPRAPIRLNIVSKGPLVIDPIFDVIPDVVNGTEQAFFKITKHYIPPDQPNFFSGDEQQNQYIVGVAFSLSLRQGEHNSTISHNIPNPNNTVGIRLLRDNELNKDIMLNAPELAQRLNEGLANYYIENITGDPANQLFSTDSVGAYLHYFRNLARFVYDPNSNKIGIEASGGDTAYTAGHFSNVPGDATHIAQINVQLIISGGLSQEKQDHYAKMFGLQYENVVGVRAETLSLTVNQLRWARAKNTSADGTLSGVGLHFFTGFSNPCHVIPHEYVYVRTTWSSQVKDVQSNTTTNILGIFHVQGAPHSLPTTFTDTTSDLAQVERITNLKLLNLSFTDRNGNLITFLRNAFLEITIFYTEQQ